MTDMTVVVRPATPTDPADRLLYLSAKPYYDAYAGSESRARSLLASVYGRRGHAASFEVCAVAEVDGELAGVIAWFPVAGWKDSFEGDLHANGRDAVAFYTRTKVVTSRWP